MGGGGRVKYMDSTVSRRKAQTLRVNNSCLYYQNTSTHHDISIINASNHRLSSYTATPVEAQPQPLAGQARCVAHALSAISISGLLGGIGIGPGTVGFFFSLSLSLSLQPTPPPTPLLASGLIICLALTVVGKREKLLALVVVHSMRDTGV